MPACSAIFFEESALSGTEKYPDVIQGLLGSAHNDTLIGDKRANHLEGGPGHDKIYGGVGADTLVGGPGDDTLVPGAGKDTLVFGQGDGRDTVLRFDAAEDRIDLQSTFLYFALTGPASLRSAVQILFLTHL